MANSSKLSRLMRALEEPARPHLTSLVEMLA